jgi:hypothetical protein
MAKFQIPNAKEQAIAAQKTAEPKFNKFFEDFFEEINDLSLAGYRDWDDTLSIGDLYIDTETKYFQDLIKDSVEKDIKISYFPAIGQDIKISASWR